MHDRPRQVYEIHTSAIHSTNRASANHHISNGEGLGDELAFRTYGLTERQLLLRVCSKVSTQDMRPIWRGLRILVSHLPIFLQIMVVVNA